MVITYNNYSNLQQNMLATIQQELKLNAIHTGVEELSDKVLQAMLTVKRDLFVEKKYKHLAYNNIPLPIEEQQTISQPFIVALMTELLDLQPTDWVLEIGTGSGYQTAILAMLAKQIYTIEFFDKLYAKAHQRFKQMHIKNILGLRADGSTGWQEYAPYNKIIVTANMKNIPSALIEQLYPNGIMVIPMGNHLEQKLYKISKNLQNAIMLKSILRVQFVPIIYA